jgi:hypothetical protein
MSHAVDLEQIDRALAEDPDNVELRYAQAWLREELGRPDEAKQAYLAVLQIDPGHFAALNNLATMLASRGYTRDAAVLYAEAVKRHPYKVMAYVNLGNAYFELREYQAAREAYEAALYLDPENQVAHHGLGNALSRLGHEELSAQHFARAFQGRPVLAEILVGPQRVLRVLTLFDASIGNVSSRELLDSEKIEEIKLAAAYFDVAQSLPPHDVIFNVIGDADRCAPGLERAAEIVAKSKAPVINDPTRVLATARANIGRYRAIDGVITPATALVARTLLDEEHAAATLRSEGFTFPLLIRAPGYHAGDHFERVESLGELSRVVRELPGERVLLIEYLDARDVAGLFRKYRVIAVRERIFPLHLAISEQWKVHYFSAAMAEHEERRRADAAFLRDMPAAIGSTAMHALEGIVAMLRLEFAGVDFGVDADGRLLLFEANATMSVPIPDADALWDYRRAHVLQIREAMRNVISIGRASDIVRQQ